MCTARLFSLALKFYLTGSSPINHSRHQKTRDSGLHDGEDGNHIPLRSLVLTQYWSVTDRRTYLPIIYSACKAGFAGTL